MYVSQSSECFNMSPTSNTKLGNCVSVENVLIIVKFHRIIVFRKKKDYLENILQEFII